MYRCSSLSLDVKSSASVIGHHHADTVVSRGQAV